MEEMGHCYLSNNRSKDDNIDTNLTKLPTSVYVKLVPCSFQIIPRMLEDKESNQERTL